VSTQTASRTAAQPELRARLEPVRRALLADARSEGERILAQARVDASERVEEAERRADEELQRASQRGRKVAEARTAAELARAAERARREVLATERRIWERLLADARSAAIDLRSDSRYPALHDALERLARAQLGDEVTIERDDCAGGLVAADARGRRVDYRLPALAERALDGLADDVAALW
jgi:vacuolar-type H+-ATPase subunit E/Vma4